MAKQKDRKNDETIDAAPTNDTPPIAPAPTKVDGFDLVDQHHDGFDDIDEDRGRSQIRGTLVKYDKSSGWLDTATQAAIDPTREFLVVDVVRSIRKWTPNNELADFRVLAPNEPFPDTEKLNAEAPQSEWRDAFGKHVGPWERAVYTYMVDPRTLTTFTYPTATTGGLIATSELRTAVKLARSLKGGSLCPLVQLGSAAMKTRSFGVQQRPSSKIVDYFPMGGEAKPQPLLKSAKAESTEPAKAKTELNDSLDDLLK